MTLRTDHRCYFEVMGIPLEIWTNDEMVVTAAEVAFGGFETPSSPQSPQTPVISMHLIVQEMTIPSFSRPIYRRHGARVMQSLGAAGTLIADLDRGTSYGFFSPEVPANPAFFRWHFLEFGFYVHLERQGLMGVHGAALARDGQAVLLRAANGGGKSTLAFAGFRRGWQALAEDVVWLDESRSRWWGLPRFFHLLPDAKRHFPELSDYQPALQISDELKLVINLAELDSQRVITSAMPGPVVLLQRANQAGSHWRPVLPQEAWPLWLAGVTGSEQNFPAYEATVDRLFGRGVYVLTVGDDLDAALDQLAALMDTSLQKAHG